MSFISLPLIDIPPSLPLRNDSFGLIFGGMLFFCFVLLSVARLARPNIYSSLLLASIKVAGLKSFVREEIKILSRSNILLILNYFICSTVIIWFIFFSNGKDDLSFSPLILTISFVVFSWHLGCLFFTGFITGEKDFFKELVLMKILGAEILGVIFFGVCLLWNLYDNLNFELTQFVIWTLVIEQLWRLIKGVYFVLQKGASWFYIILYLLFDCLINRNTAMILNIV